MKYEIADVRDYGYKDYRKLSKAFQVISWIIVGIVFLFIYLSIFVIFIQSFNSSSDTTKFADFTFKWYTQMFSNRSLTNSIVNSFVVSIAASILATILGTIVAVGIFALSKKKRQSMLLLNNIPMLNADIVTGVSLMIIFSLMLPIFPYLFGPTTLILAHLFFTLPYVILSVLPKLAEMDKFLLDAALDLGVKPFKAMIKVIVPSIKSGIFAGLLLAFTMSIDDFVISYYTTGNGFDNLSIWVYSSIGKRSLSPSVYAFSSALTIGILALLIVYHYIKGKKHAKR